MARGSLLYYIFRVTGSGGLWIQTISGLFFRRTKWITVIIWILGLRRISGVRDFGDLDFTL
jgi:hypothetical protein